MTPFAASLEKPSMRRTATAPLSAEPSETGCTNCAPWTVSSRLVRVMSTEPRSTGSVFATVVCVLPMVGGSVRGMTAIAFRSQVVWSL
jgi:hypothetical protein